MLFNYLLFNSLGNFRGFVMGISLKDCQKEIIAETAKGNVAIPFKDGKGLPVPSKWLESYYWKFSTENDLKVFLKGL